ncbi:probable G-protein coupled receptor 21 [Lineus longissimus]|uniref:probable G-protein coupled receptor 21 n=1 Tax=Lineus longissimus TaxID=88925 RepID=UPI00315C7DE9
MATEVWGVRDKECLVISSNGLILVIMILVVLGNIFNITVLMRTKTLRNNPGFFMLNLAITDLALGVEGLSGTFYHAALGIWPINHTSASMHGLFGQMFLGVSATTLAAVSIDRYIAISRPLIYHTVMTIKTCIIMMIVVWLSNLLVVLIPIFGYGRYEFNPNTYLCHTDFRSFRILLFVDFGIQIMPATAVITFCYWRIFLISKRAHEDIAKLNIGATYKQKPKKNAMKAVRTIGITVVAYYISWMPFSILQLINAFTVVNFPKVMDFSISFLGISNSFMNCIIYCITHRDFYRGAKDLMCCLCNRNRVGSFDSGEASSHSDQSKGQNRRWANSKT